VLPKTVDPSFLRVADGGVHERTHYVWRPAGAFLRKRATDRHRIKTERDTGAWTVFVQFRKVQPWGFYTEHGKVYWYDYDRVRCPIEAARTASAEEALLRRGRMSAISGANRG
jgi:hypothetical protein